MVCTNIRAVCWTYRVATPERCGKRMNALFDTLSSFQQHTHPPQSTLACTSAATCLLLLQSLFFQLLEIGRQSVVW